MRTKMLLGALLLALASPSIEAQPRLRPLQVPANASWQHAETGLVLPPMIDGLSRRNVSDTSAEELDISSNYESADGQLTTTVYLFRPQIASVPLWFDRARTVFEQLNRFAVAASGPLPTRAFALGEDPQSSGLGIVYPLSDGDYAASGIAVASMGGWIVKLRTSAKSMDAAALETRLAAFMRAMRLPKGLALTAATAELSACPAPLKLKQAKMVRPDMTQTLLVSVLSIAASSKPRAAPGTFCKEAAGSANYGLYRADASSNSYIMGLADSGRLISVAETMDLTRQNKRASYSVTLMDLGRTSVFPSFDRLPKPDQVVKMLGTSRPLSSVKVGTTTVEISAGAAAN